MKTTKKLSKNQLYIIDCLKNEENLQKGITYNIEGRICFPAWVKYTNTIKSLINMDLLEVVEYNKYTNQIEWVSLTENNH